MFKFIFFLSILALGYTYFGYPLLLAVLMKFKKERPILKKNITLQVSIVISAYNEEEAIAEKLYNLFSLDYPRKNMEIVVVSDVSSDRTDEIVKEFADEGVKLHRLRQRSGKIAAYRSVFPYLEGEIVVFTDATSHLEKDSIKNLVSNFNDKSVGCVGGLLLYTNHQDAFVGEGEGRYWEYEKKVKEYESSLSSLTSISGTLYAVRKELYPCNIKDDLADDLIVPLTVKKRGLRTVLEPKAICRESTNLSVRQEMAKRIRITIQNIRGLIDQAEILNPFRYGLYSLLVASHKLLRLLAPAFLLMLFVANLVLAMNSRMYLVIFMAQVAFYFVGALVLKKGDSSYFWAKESKAKNGTVPFLARVVNSVFYFCLSNLAILVGIVEFFKGKKIAIWEPIRVGAQWIEKRLLRYDFVGARNDGVETLVAKTRGGRGREKMKVLVIGHTGFIGRFLTQKLIDKGYEVVGLGTRALEPKQCHTIIGDILNPEDIMKAAIGADAIINLAAKHQDFGVSREDFYKVNVGGTQNILDCASRMHIKKFIFYSTVAVYGNHKSSTTEATTPEPVSDYGKSKLAAEGLIHRWVAKEPSRQAVIIRPTVVFGPENFANMYNLINSIYKRRFVFVGKGENIKSVAYVENLVDATIFLLERLKPGVDIYNYSDYPQMTVEKIVKTISGHLNYRHPRIKVPLKTALVATSIFDLMGKLTGYNFPITANRIKKFNTATHHKAEKIRAEGFQASVDLSEGFRRMCEWYVSNGNGKRLDNKGE